METKINYIIGTWSGSGRSRSNENFIKKHINHLNTLTHNLTQVSIGYPNNPKVSKEYDDYMKSLSSLNDGTPIVVYEMKNHGLSYGQYSHIFNLCRDAFSHFIINEDDYVPNIDNFDSILYDRFNTSCDCGYLCGLTFGQNTGYGRHHRYPHAAISHGITSNSVLSDIWKKFDNLPHQKEKKPTKPEQIVFSESFLKIGYKIDDILPEYRCLYYEFRSNTIREYGNSDKDIFVPIQYLDPNPSWNYKKIEK